MKKIGAVALAAIIALSSVAFDNNSVYAEGETEVTETEVTETEATETETGDVTNSCGDSHTWDAGTVTVNATVLASGKKEYKCSVCGETKEETIAKLKPTIKLSKKKVTLRVGKSVKIKVSKLAKGDKVKSWKSSKKKVATVKRGKIKAKKKGRATITVTLKSGKKAKVKVVVKAKKKKRKSSSSSGDYELKYTANLSITECMRICEQNNCSCRRGTLITNRNPGNCAVYAWFAHKPIWVKVKKN